MYRCLGTTSIFLYDVFTIFISSFALLMYNLSQYKIKCTFLSDISNLALLRIRKNRPSAVKQFIILAAIAEIVLISLFQHGLVSPLNKMLGEWLRTGDNYFGMIFAMPFLLSLLCWLVGLDPYKQIDLITPAYPLALFFMKLGCSCAGCCRGIPCSFGFYNYASERLEFPIQLLEAAIALSLFFLLHFRKKKIPTGMLLPVYITLYCTIRFFSEFLRAESSVFLFLKTYHVLCLLGIGYGLLLIFILKKYRCFLDQVFAHSLPVLLQRIQR